jgi:hypothetical protein
MESTCHTITISLHTIADTGNVENTLLYKVNITYPIWNISINVDHSYIPATQRNIL